MEDISDIQQTLAVRRSWRNGT